MRPAICALASNREKENANARNRAERQMGIVAHKHAPEHTECRQGNQTGNRQSAEPLMPHPKNRADRNVEETLEESVPHIRKNGEIRLDGKCDDSGRIGPALKQHQQVPRKQKARRNNQKPPRGDPPRRHR